MNEIHFFPGKQFGKCLEELIHLPGARGNPERAYPIAALGDVFPGTFQNYAASVIAHWKESSNPNLERLGDDLASLGLTWKVEPHAVDDTRVELKVARLMKPTHGGASDLVNIADVGLGVSQTLPVVVALLVARPGQMVFIEQPEIHLHPRAQFAMAGLLANAAGSRYSCGCRNSQFAPVAWGPVSGCGGNTASLECRTALVSARS